MTAQDGEILGQRQWKPRPERQESFESRRQEIGLRLEKKWIWAWGARRSLRQRIEPLVDDDG